MQAIIIGIIILFFIILFLKDFDKYYVLFIVVNPLIREFSTQPLLSPISTFIFLSSIASIIYLYKYKWTFIQWKNKGIFWVIVILCISVLVSEHYASERHPLSVYSIIINYTNILIYCDVLRHHPKEIIRHTFRYSLIFGGIVGSFALFEMLTSYNPYIHFTSFLKIYSENTIITEMRFGIKRTQTFFSMHETNAGVSFLLITLLSFIRAKGETIRTSKICYLVIFLLGLNIFASGSRAAIIGLLILSCLLLRKKNLKMIFVLSPFILLLINFFLHDYLNNIISSFTNTENIAGSNIDMRSQQFNIALYYLSKSPWIGHGIAYTWNYVAIYDHEIFGAESLWLPVIIDQGLLGVTTYILFFLYSLYYAISKKNAQLCFFIVGFVIFNSLSSIPKVPFSYIYIVLFAIIESNKLFKNNAPIHYHPSL